VFDSFRTLLARHLFSPLQGATWEEWWPLLARHRCAVDPQYWPRAALLTLAGLSNSAFARLEEWKYGQGIDATVVRPLLFILGHYRSGTTHLHNLLSLDPQFAYPRRFATGCFQAYGSSAMPAIIGQRFIDGTVRDVCRDEEGAGRPR
jgi:hypothetical protein